MSSPGEPIHVWFCSSDKQFAQIVSRALGRDFDLRISHVSEEAFVPGQYDACDVVLLDLRSENGTSLEDMLRIMAQINGSDCPIVVMMVHDDRSLVRKLSENGAYDTVQSPPDIVELRRVLRRASRFHDAQREVLRWRSQGTSGANLFDLVGSSDGMQQVFSLVKKIAPCDVNVLITGETGTGKSLLSRTMHRLSQRANGPFVEFSCANMPEHLVEDELFGHEKGAFTGAVAARRGRFEAAEKGTLFLDEIGDLPLGLQAKLLRVLQERTFERLGSNTPRSADIRLICATHRNLGAMVKEGAFREDLYYRLNVVQIHLPALRERQDGIPLLAYHFLERFAQRFAKPVKRFSPPAMNALEEHAWPGNVRELENAVQHAVVLADGAAIEMSHLPSSIRGGGSETTSVVRSYEDEVREFKRRLVLRTLRECGGNKAESARVLGLARGYLHRLVNQLEIEPRETATETELLEEDLFSELDEGKPKDGNGKVKPTLIRGASA